MTKNNGKIDQNGKKKDEKWGKIGLLKIRKMGLGKILNWKKWWKLCLKNWGKRREKNVKYYRKIN